jgi:RimJ/RimL family protein N-acetyltransferase
MLIGKRVRLRAIEPDDIPRFATWLNDQEVRQYLTIYLPFSLAEEHNWYDNMLKRPGEEHPLAIDIKPQTGDWLHVGNIGFNQVDFVNRSAEIGIFIGEKQLWNQGYGKDAMALMVHHGFMNLNLHRIYLHVYESNPRAVHSYEKAGFVHEGRLRQAKYQNGRYVDVLVMSVLNSEWKNSE